jgi:DNA-binding response OmpR family regulator
MISVLYVDDEPVLLEILKLMLEATHEFSVVTALTAEEGLNALQAGTYDAIVSDFQMTGMDGIEFLKEVRSTFGDIPFILFTGRGREEIVIDALNNGADFYLQKGGEPKAEFAELAHKIRSAVFRKKTEAALRESRNFLNDVFNSIQDGILVIDREMNILRVNKTLKNWYPDTLPLAGKKCYEAYYGRSVRCEICPSSETLASGKPAKRIVARTENGNISCWYEFFSYPLTDSSTGEVYGVIEYVRNITDKIVADEMLKAAYEKLTLSQEELRYQYVEMAQGKYHFPQSKTEFPMTGEACTAGESQQMT